VEVAWNRALVGFQKSPPVRQTVEYGYNRVEKFGAISRKFVQVYSDLADHPIAPRPISHQRKKI